MDQYKVSESKRRLVTTYLGIWGFGSRPILSTPGLPPERLQILREAFAKMFKDPEFEEDLKKRKWEVKPVSGEELQTLAKEVVNQPADVTAALKRILGQ
jgi:tripartite-type tricarboxylate transporter receptor subunit TctC